MKLYLPNGLLKQSADTDVSDLTTAKRSGDAYWAPDEPDVLVVPFDQEPTAAEQAMIERRLTTDTSVEEALQKRVSDAYQGLLDYEKLPTPGNAQTIAVVKLLCKVARALIRLQLRQFDAVD